LKKNPAGGLNRPVRFHYPCNTFPFPLLSSSISGVPDIDPPFAGFGRWIKKEEERKKRKIDLQSASRSKSICSSNGRGSLGSCLSCQGVLSRVTGPGLPIKVSIGRWVGGQTDGYNRNPPRSLPAFFTSYFSLTLGVVNWSLGLCVRVGLKETQKTDQKQNFIPPRVQLDTTPWSSEAECSFFMCFSKLLVFL